MIRVGPSAAAFRAKLVGRLNLKGAQGLHRWARHHRRVPHTLASAFATLPEDDLEDRRITDAYRRWGHFHAELDPLGLAHGHNRLELDPAQILKGAHVSERARSLISRLSSAYCGKIGAEFEHLDSAEERDWWAAAMENSEGNFRHLPGRISPSERRNAAMLMLQADALEQFLARRFPGFKRYSGEGAEAMQPAVHAILAAAAAAASAQVPRGAAAEAAEAAEVYGGVEVGGKAAESFFFGGKAAEAAVISMPHRGRLALLASQLDYPLRRLFWKVRGNSEFPESLEGVVDDVTSHIAASVTKTYENNAKLRVSLLHNPSHLEIGGAVALGKARAKAVGGSCRVLPLLMHGDAALSGQGCVAEALAMAKLPGFDVGGAVHLVVNNQIGFTTTEREGRSGHYCTDVAKSIGAPVLHVNGGDPDAVMAAAKLATRYWRQFGRDVFLDLVTYRRHGHNEVDEPAFTQPSMYRAIRAYHEQGRGCPQMYAAQLQAEGLLVPEKVRGWTDRFEKHLEAELAASESLDLVTEPPDAFKGKWSEMRHPSAKDRRARVDTGAPVAALTAAALASITVPEGFEVHPRLLRGHVEARRKQVESSGVVDWATAEAMAFGTLLAEGHSVRLCGQDVGRGTFSQRHARLVDQAKGRECCPLDDWEGAKGRFEAVNSHLSELAVLAFEFGYSWEDPNTLCLWEAQFGDFANCAQMVIDQYISGSEAKWLRQTGLTLLLPHGMDGAGPEHSSGRIERFLQLVDDPGIAPIDETHPQESETSENSGIVARDGAANLALNASGGSSSNESDASNALQEEKDSFINQEPSLFFGNYNMCVCHPSTPASYFHLLRRQQRRNFRKPLVVFVPKTLLRLPEAVSPLEHMSEGTYFEPVLADPLFLNNNKNNNNNNEQEKNVKRVIICSGKLFYDLHKRRNKNAENGSGSNAMDTAILRLEQLAPFPHSELRAMLKQFPNLSAVTWAQEEPLNAGAFAFVYPQIRRAVGPNVRVNVVARPVLPTPAVGLSKRNAAQAEDLLKRCFP